MEVPSLGVKSELLLSAYTTAMVVLDPSYVCNLHHRTHPPSLLNPPSEANNQTHTLLDAIQVR